MRTRDIKSLPTKTDAELRTMLRETRESLTAARLELAQRKLTNTTSLTTFRQDIARIQTVLNDTKRVVPVVEAKSEKKATKTTETKNKGGKK